MPNFVDAKPVITGEEGWKPIKKLSLGLVFCICIEVRSASTNFYSCIYENLMFSGSNVTKSLSELSTPSTITSYFPLLSVK